MSLPPYDQSIRDLERQYQVVLPDSVGQAALGFREGVWFRVNAGAPRPVPIRSAIILCPHAAGSIVQIACWWMRENARTSRALDLATELALCVGELARKAVEDDPLGMSLDPLSNSQQNAVAGFAAPLAQDPSAGYGAGAGAAAGAGVGGAGGYEGGYENGYGTGGYQAPADPYAAPAYPAPVSSAATTVLPQIPADGGGYGMPPAQRGPAIPPRGAGGPGGQQPMPLGSGGYPQRPAQPVSGQPMRPQQPGGRYPQGPGPNGRPQQQRPMPRPERYEDEFRGDLPGRPPSRPSGRPDPGSAW